MTGDAHGNLSSSTQRDHDWPTCPPASSAATCHVFVVSRFVLPADKPDDACVECGEPLAVHEKRTSSLIPRDKVFVIDEKALNV